MVFNLKSVIPLSVLKGEEQDFKDMIESEYRIRFQLMVEEKTNFQRLQGGVSNSNLREEGLNQLMEVATELKEKSQETLQVRGGKQHAHSVWELREGRAEHYASSKNETSSDNHERIKRIYIYSPSSSISDHSLIIYLHAYKKI